MKKNNLTTSLQIRCTQKEKELLKSLALEHGQTVSEYFRTKVFGNRMTVVITKKGIKEI